MIASSESANDLRPVCFMVMPYKRKPVTGAAPGAPAEVDFDMLWERALRPAIEQLGYLPVRADSDPGSLIVNDMIERLAFADLVLADVSIPSGNVYYEVGIRHVARETGCVLVAADWSRQLFDIDQFRSVRYALAASEVSDDEALAIQQVIVQAVPKLQNSNTPYHETVGKHKWDDANQRGVFRDFMEQLSEFQGKVRSIRLLPSDKRPSQVLALAEEFEQSMHVPEVSLDLLRLFRDELNWQRTLEFIEQMPKKIRKLSFVREQLALVLGNSGEPEKAIAGLETLIAEQGPNPERHGLIGGRYKRLWRDARNSRIDSGGDRPDATERRYLAKAIEHYTLGMQQDYNQYYCSANLPSLLRARDADGDAEHAPIIEHFVIAACERAIALGSSDEWVWPTLLGAAFRAGDLRKANELADKIETGEAPRWNLRSTLNDLTDVISQSNAEETTDELRSIHERLSQMLQT